MRLRIRLAVVYFVTCGVFALTYFSIWRHSPDHFLVDQEVNMHPISLLEHLLWEEYSGEEVTYKGPSSLAVMIGEANALGSALRSKEDSVQLMSEHMEATEARATSISERIAAEVDSNLALAQERVLAPLLNQRDSLYTVMESVGLMGSVSVPVHSNEVLLLIQGLRIEIAELNVEIAKEQLRLSSQVLEERVRFIDKETYDEWSGIHADISVGLNTASRLLRERGDLRSQCADRVREWRRQRGAQLDLLDFVYFSVSVSTTTLIGDIRPNDPLSRGAVCVQLLACLVIVGFIINSLGR